MRDLQTISQKTQVLFMHSFARAIRLQLTR